jgi:hypothetical protein
MKVGNIKPDLTLGRPHTDNGMSLMEIHSSPSKAIALMDIAL